MKSKLGLDSTPLGASTCTATELPATQLTPRMEHWQALHYGMFIHYGMSTFTLAEIDDGEGPSAKFAPPQSDTDQWIKVAKAAGMKYAVLTAKHVAGHCLWDSKVRYRGQEFDYDVATSGNRQDVVGNFIAACQQHDILPGLYYCLMDRHNGIKEILWQAKELPAEYFQFVKDQLAELNTRYPAIRIMWLDIPRLTSLAQRAEMYQLIRSINPNCVVMFNLSNFGRDGQSNLATTQGIAWPGDVLNSERLPAGAPFQHAQIWQGKSYWLGYEHCDCLGKEWFWTPQDKPRPTEELFKLYDAVVNSAGGNLLLDVGPGQDGRISEDRIDALMNLKARIEQDHSLRA